MTFSYPFYLWVTRGKGQVNLKEIFFSCKSKVILFNAIFYTIFMTFNYSFRRFSIQNLSTQFHSYHNFLKRDGN